MVYAVLVVVALGGLGLLHASVHKREAARQLDLLWAFGATLEGGEVEGEPSFWRGFRGIAVHGRRNGVQRRLFFARRSDRLCYELLIPEPVAELGFEITRSTYLARVGKVLGLDPERYGEEEVLNRSFTIRGKGGALARLAQVSELEEVLSELFEAGLSQVRLEFGRLVAVLPIRKEDDEILQPLRLEGTFQLLERIVSACERVQVKRDDIQVFGWTGGGGEVRCPYCRDALGAELSDCTACAHCSTLHHGECLEEAGGCTVFGCQGRPEAAVVT